MPSTRIRTAVAALAASAVVSTGALAGCSISRDDEPSSQQGSGTTGGPATATPSEPTDPTPTVSPTPTPSEPTQPEQSKPPRTIEQALLTGPEMPQLNDSSAWDERDTGPAGSDSFGLCQKFDLLSIGALDVVERTFDTPGGDAAGQQVAEFPDAQNAVRAGKVVAAWQRDCAGRVPGKKVKVGSITDVPVSTGTGWHYLVRYVRDGTGHFHALGLAASGTRLTLIRMDHDGQDHNYDEGMDPMELAVLAAAVKLG